MSVIIEKYSPGRIDMLNRILQNDHGQGQPRDYEIKVDGLKVVQRTNDPERFFQHEDYLQRDTVCLTIAIYEQSSRNCQQKSVRRRKEICSGCRKQFVHPQKKLHVRAKCHRK